MSKVLVTGATGNVGSSLVGELRGRGVPVRAFVRDPGRAAARLGPGLELAVGDLADRSSVEAALQGVDMVFLACGNHPGQVACEATVIDAAARAGVRRLVKLSAYGAETGSRLPYWDWHGRLERQLKASGLPWVLLQPAFYMTNLLGSAESIRAAGAIFAPAEGAKLPMIDPRDVAAAAAAALTGDGHEGRTYVLTGPETVTFQDVAAQLARATGRPVRFVALPDAAALEGLLQAGMPDWMAQNLVTAFSLLREGAVPPVTDTVHTLTGRPPRDLAAFADDHAGLFAP